MTNVPEKRTAATRPPCVCPRHGGRPDRPARPAERDVVPEPVGPQIAVVGHDPQLERAHRHVVDDPRLGVAVTQALRKGDVHAGPETLAERQPRRGVEFRGDSDRIAAYRRGVWTAKPKRVEADCTAGKAKHLGRKIAEHLRSDEGGVARRQILEPAAREEQRCHFRAP